MTVTYYTNAGAEKHFDRDTIEACILEYVRRKRGGRAHWGHVYVNGERMYL